MSIDTQIETLMNELKTRKTTIQMLTERLENETKDFEKLCKRVTKGIDGFKTKKEEPINYGEGMLERVFWSPKMPYPAKKEPSDDDGQTSKNARCDGRREELVSNECFRKPSIARNRYVSPMMVTNTYTEALIVLLHHQQGWNTGWILEYGQVFGWILSPENNLITMECPGVQCEIPTDFKRESDYCIPQSESCGTEIECMKEILELKISSL